jgi:hypothetical protein
LSQGLEKLGRDQVNRPQIGKARLPACEVPVSNEGARMGIALDAMALLRRLAEMVNPIGATATTELEGTDPPSAFVVRDIGAVQVPHRFGTVNSLRLGRS